MHCNNARVIAFTIAWTIFSLFLGLSNYFLSFPHCDRTLYLISWYIWSGFFLWFRFSLHTATAHFHVWKFRGVVIALQMNCYLTINIHVFSIGCGIEYPNFLLLRVFSLFGNILGRFPFSYCPITTKGRDIKSLH